MTVSHFLACFLKISIRWSTADLVEPFLGMTPFKAWHRSSPALKMASDIVTAGCVRHLCLKNTVSPYAYTSCIRDPNSVAVVVFPRITNVETSLGMGFVRLLFGGSYMHLYCRAEGRKRIGVVVMLAIKHANAEMLGTTLDFHRIFN